MLYRDGDITSYVLDECGYYAESRYAESAQDLCYLQWNVSHCEFGVITDSKSMF